MRALAVNTFVSFLFLLLIAFIYLLPAPTPPLWGWLLILTNLISVGRVIVQGLIAYRTKDRTLGSGRIILRFILPGLGYALVIPLVLPVVDGDYSWLYWLAGLFLIQLGLAVTSVWDLMLIVGRDKRSSAT